MGLELTVPCVDIPQIHPGNQFVGISRCQVVDSFEARQTIAQEVLIRTHSGRFALLLKFEIWKESRNEHEADCVHTATADLEVSSIRPSSRRSFPHPASRYRRAEADCA